MNNAVDSLDFLLEEKMISFFHCNKTQIAYGLEDPQIFLSHLRDNNLVQEDHYQKVIRMTSKRRQKGVHQILEQLEKEGGHCIKLFWTCVFQDHIKKKNPIILSLQNELLKDVNHPNAENPRNTEKGSVSRENEATKRKKATEKSNIDEPGPSSLSHHNQEQPAERPYDNELFVTCGNLEGILYRDKLARGVKCIKTKDRWFTTNDFELFGGRGKSKNWKQSIRHNGDSLKTLIEKGVLSCPRTMKRKVQQVHPATRSRAKKDQPVVFHIYN